jgi:hypothetical protein
MGILYYDWAQMHPFTSRVLNIGELDLTYDHGFKGAIGSAPWFWNNRIHNKNVPVSRGSDPKTIIFLNDTCIKSDMP